MSEAISDRTMANLPSVMLTGGDLHDDDTVTEDASQNLFDTTLDPITSTQISTPTQSDDTTVSAKAECSQKKSKLCVDGCKFQGTGSQARKRSHGQKLGPVQCHICQLWVHPPCVGEKDDDIINIWSCPSCRTMPTTVNNIMNILKKIQDDNDKLQTTFTTRLDAMQDLLNQRDSNVQKLTDKISVKTSDHNNAITEITSLRTKVSELNSKLNEATWINFRSQQKDRSLLVGSSIIRDINEKNLDNTEVICLRGGRINDVKNAVTDKATEAAYDRVVLVAGGNDCAPRDTSTDVLPSSIVDEYRSLVRVSKSKAKSVTVSSVCPRDISSDVKKYIESVNAGLQVMCTEEDATFIDNTPSFHLADGNVNDGYYLNDRIHLTHKATDKLALNLKLNIKKGCKSVCDSQPNRRPKEAPKEQSITQVNQTMTDNDVDLSHSFWSRAARKVTPKQRHTYPTNRRSRQTQVNKDRRMDEGNTSNGNDVNTGNRCFNCYETNHTAKTCRHEGPLICNDCGAEGHKAKHHSY